MAEIFFITVVLIYLLTHIYLYSGFRKSLSLKKDSSNSIPKVSVIVAAKNEEQNIADCIRALSRLNYPHDRLEIILVNDNSSDKTFQVMSDETKSFDFFKVINSRKSPEGNLKGKANAIDTAIEQSTGDIIVSTDADCKVPPGWVSETVRYFSKETEMVCGFTFISTDKSLFAKVQCIDWMYLLTLASASCGLNQIMSCIGNNLSFTKSAYEKVGGYSSINFSVTEDLALMRKINSQKKGSIKFPVDTDGLVKTLPCKNLKELFSQKRRWFRGGIGINFLGYIIGIELYLVNFLLVFGFFFLSIKVYLAAVLIKTISELLLLSAVFSRLRTEYLYKYYIPYIFYFAFYGLVLPLSFLSGKKINWKGQKF